MITIHLLLGGMTGGFFDYPFNPGMLGLRSRLQKIPGVAVTTWTWGRWQEAAGEIVVAHRPIVVIGYSGGGSRATYVCNAVRPTPIALFVAYDPSPAGQMRPIHDNVRKAINYHNTKPGMWWPGIGTLGGGVVTGVAVDIETINIAEFHLTVQFDNTLHDRTVAAVEALAAAA